ncbi:MAG: LamG domain-containing protein [Candidatus Aureabacteria bacterium]|nr:LamG domain-containing protein [Candidatus Auribacterota bacterium]
MRATLMVAVSVISMACVCGMAVAGSIDSPGVPSGGSGMHTIGQLYNYLNSGTDSSIPGGFQGPAGAPGPTVKTLEDVYQDIKAKLGQSTVSAADVKSGEKFFCTLAGSWGVQTGAAQLVPTPTPTPTITPTITPTSSLYSGLVDYYKLDEISGTTAVDSKNSHNGTNNGATVDQAGKINTAYSFDGTNDYINCGSIALNNTDFSLSAWVYIETPPNDEGIIFAQGTGDGGLTFYLSYIGPTSGDVDHREQLAFATWNSYGVFTPVTTLAWHCVTLTFKTSNKNANLYLDGSLKSSNNLTHGYTGTGNLNIGKNDYAYSRWFKGKIDEAAIWNRELSSSEVSELWNNGSGKALF